MGLGAIITPAACVPVWFFKPSMCSASFTRLCTCEFSSQSFFSSIPSKSASFNFVPGVEGTIAAQEFACEKGMSYTLHTALSAAFAASVPKVII